MDAEKGSKKMNMKIMNTMQLICCKVFISEARNRSALDAIERAAKLDPDVVIIFKFEDPEYNRVRYTLVSYVVPHGGSAGAAYSPIRRTVHAMVEAAFASIDLETHCGAHPRLGVVDHICFHPLVGTKMEDAAHIAKLVASDIGNELRVPVFLYEAAHPNGRQLDAIRRELGYYRPNFMGNQWAGWALPEVLPETPDEGPARVSRSRGITIIGASPWVIFYNVPVLCTDVDRMKRIARMVSERGGGLPTVQALALVHGKGCIEIACNLLDPTLVGEDRVQRRVEMIASEEGLEVKKGYSTDLSQDMIVERYMKLVLSA